MYPLGRGGTGGTWAASPSFCCEATEPSLPRRPPAGLVPGVDEGVVEDVGRECESREFGVPATLVDEDDSRFSVRARWSCSCWIRIGAETGNAGISSPRSSQLLSGDCLSSRILFELTLVLRRVSLVGVLRGGVAGRLVEVTSLDIFDFPLPLPGVVPSPSNLRSASAVSTVTSRDHELAPPLSVCVTGRDPLLSRFVATKYEAEGLMPGGVLPVPAPAVEKLCVEAEPRRNWLIEADDGLGGRCEKSFGTKCLRMS